MNLQYKNRSKTFQLQALETLVCSRTSPHHKYSPVAVSVDAPQFNVGLGSDSSRSWGAVDQCQLSKAATFPYAGHPFIVHIHLPDWKRDKPK